jgi:hypothetical protein
MPKFTLSKTACMWSGEGPGENFDHPVRYEIGGMPAGRVAHIEMSGHASDRWQILDDVTDKRYGDFESADDALASLQADVENQ